jgi:hypothetical protein
MLSEATEYFREDLLEFWRPDDDDDDDNNIDKASFKQQKEKGWGGGGPKQSETLCSHLTLDRLAYSLYFQRPVTPSRPRSLNTLTMFSLVRTIYLIAR